MPTERTGRRRVPSRDRVGKPLPIAGEPSLSRMSDRELMRRLAMREPERYGAAYIETMRAFALEGLAESTNLHRSDDDD